MAKILVVDDDPDFVEATRIVLEQEGHTIASAADGSEALGKIAEDTPDLIILDVIMSTVLDGLSVSQELGTHPEYKDIPIIMITSRVGQKHRAKAIEIGVDDYLGKPYQESQLLDAIEQLVHHGRTNVY